MRHMRTLPWGCTCLIGEWHSNWKAAHRAAGAIASKGLRDSKYQGEALNFETPGAFFSASLRTAGLWLLNCKALARWDGDRLVLAQTLPRQANDQGASLFRGELHLCVAGPRPVHAALMQPTYGQPDAEAIAHQHLQPCATAVGKYVGVVWLRGAEDFDHLGQQPIHAAAHVHWIDCQPDPVNADHRNHSRRNSPHCAAALTGQVTRIVVVPRVISILMASLLGAVAATLTGTKGAGNAGAGNDGRD